MIRMAGPRDAEFLAWAILTASRGMAALVGFTAGLVVNPAARNGAVASPRKPATPTVTRKHMGQGAWCGIGSRFGSTNSARARSENSRSAE